MAYIESKKNELYTADELCAIKTALSETTEKSASLIEKITKMQNSIRDRNRQAIFFMPEKTYNLFSIFQGQNAICDIGKNDIKTLLKLLERTSLSNKNSQISQIIKKLKILNEFLQQGNVVKPVVTAADVLSVQQS